MQCTAYVKHARSHVKPPAFPYLRAIHLCLLLLVIFPLQSFFTGEQQVVSLSFKEAPLTKVFTEIRRQTGYSFAYFDTDVALAKPVNINISNVRVQEALTLIFREQPLSFTIIEKVVVVKQKTEKKTSLTDDQHFVPSQQLIDVEGRVLNERDDPVAGVTVQVKGTRTGTSTNGEGEFALKRIASTTILIFSAVNIEPVETPVHGQRNLEIRVKGKSSKLDEVQVIAYGKTSQRFNVGNVTTVKAADIERQPVSNPLLALQGRVPGLVVTQETGMNGGGIKIRVQGENSIANGNNPLIIVDGVPYPSELPVVSFSDDLLGNNGAGSPLSFININDIESIDVLKDADATSIYGSRAANGAILITTKKGRPGKMRLNINLQQGWSRVTRRMDMLNTRQYLDMRYEAMRNSALIPTDKTGQAAPYVFAADLTLWDTTRYTDWQQELIGGTAQYSNFNVSLSGGNATSSYLVGMTYNRNTDVFPGDHALKSGALHFNLNTASLNQRFKVQLTGTYTVNQNSLPGADLTAAAIRLVPVAPPLFSSDTLNWAPDATGIDTWDNPLANTYYAQYRSDARTLYSNLTISYVLLPGLELRGQLGYTYVQSRSSRKTPLIAIRPANRPTSTRSASFNNSVTYNYIAEPQLAYNKQWGKAQINALLGSTLQQNNIQSISLNGSGYNSDLLLNGIAGAASYSTSLNQGIYKYNAAFARIGLNWDNAYLLSLNARRDGSSRFGDKRRFHNFASIGGGWIFSETKLVKRHFSWLNFGKLRMSYGTTGSDQVGDYSFLSNNIPFANPDIIYQGVASLYAENLLNPYLQWEETRKLQVGMDISLWQDRLQLILGYSRNRCSNQLINYNLPAITGFPTVQENLPATLQNTSWELVLTTINLKTPRLKWSSSINLTLPRNKVISFPGIENTIYKSPFQGIIVGQPRGSIWQYHYTGMDPATGKQLVADQNGNPGTFGTNTQFISLNPLYYGGFQHSLTYHNLSLDFLLQFMRQWGTRAFDYWNGEYIPGYALRGRGNQPLSVLNRWQKPGDQTTAGPYSAVSATLGILNQSDVFYTLDASYIRLKNVSLSWQLSPAFCKKMGLESGRVYTQAQNLFTLTRFTGLDPENQSATSLPPLRTWTVGIQVVL